MLSGFECDEDQTGWLAGIAVWTVGAAAGCLVAVSTVEPALMHWQVLAAAVAVSLVSLGLRLPVMLTQCTDRVWLVHAVWMLAVFAQVNWAGFLAIRSSSGTIAAEAIAVCLGLEIWLLVLFVSRGQLPWLKQFFNGSTIATQPVASAPLTSNPLATSDNLIDQLPQNQSEDIEEERGDIRRELVDGIDENGQRYLSGSVRVNFDAEQRTESFVLSFCPALNGIAEVELECDTEEVTAKVEHVTETGARVLVRRQSIGETSVVSVDWFAVATRDAPVQHSLSLP